MAIIDSQSRVNSSSSITDSYISPSIPPATTPPSADKSTYQINTTTTDERPYVFPESLENPEGSMDSPRNAIKFEVLDFQGGTLDKLLNLFNKIETKIQNDLKLYEEARKQQTEDSNPENPGVVDQFVGMVDAVVSGGFDAIKSIRNSPELVEAVSEIVNTTNDRIKPNPKPLATIFLYAPNSIVSEYAFQYKQEDLTPTYKALDLINQKAVSGIAIQGGASFISDTIKNIGGGFLSTTLGGNVDLEKLITAKTRAVPIENLEFLFERVDRRTFQYTFKMYPRSKREIMEIGKIISTFKYYGHPVLFKENRYLQSPSIFQLQYVTHIPGKGWVPNLYLNKIKYCALTNISIDYTDSGVFSTIEAAFEAYTNGTLKSPVGISLKLDFQELLILNREDMVKPTDFGKNISDTNLGYH